MTKINRIRDGKEARKRVAMVEKEASDGRPFIAVLVKIITENVWWAGQNSGLSLGKQSFGTGFLIDSLCHSIITLSRDPLCQKNYSNLTNVYNMYIPRE